MIYQCYEALNSDSSDLSKYDHECNEITVHHPRDEMIKICKKYLSYLEYCRLLHDEKSRYDFLWGYFDYYRIDEPYYLKYKPNFEIVNHNDWDKRKKLYDYYVDSDILIGSEQDTVVGLDVPGLGTRSETEVTSEASQIGTKLDQSVLGITPVLLTASALYRYTPIGSWIRNLGKNSTNSISYMDGEMEGFLGNTQESGDILLGETSNYISYQPM
ncbi:PIR Superfamily Protein [Plasmodium ovale curtisi]|uniref:PIR Superfamily Protein n=1 Tax=Plasmodium ovale curtisi TaxID=864141 RepID=A0A1A8WFP1_PLAOA|nr:PIR Superfamily Protein [Plasmodium ovale curtisi]